MPEPHEYYAAAIAATRSRPDFRIGDLVMGVDSEENRRIHLVNCNGVITGCDLAGDNKSYVYNLYFENGMDISSVQARHLMSRQDTGITRYVIAFSVEDPAKSNPKFQYFTSDTEDLHTALKANSEFSSAKDYVDGVQFFLNSQSVTGSTFEIVSTKPNHYKRYNRLATLEEIQEELISKLKSHAKNTL